MKIKYGVLFTAVLLLLASIFTACSPQQGTIVAEAAPIMKVHFIDVGQADCALIQLSDGKTVLIDGGNRADAPVVLKYLKAQGIKTIDFLIATHPHEDHIGSLPEVVKNYEIGSIYMPKATANTKIFEDLLLAIKAKGYKINTAAAGVKLIDTADTSLTILAPAASEYDETNNYSAVAKLTYKNTSFLFTGDAEDVLEREMLKSNMDLKADLLKVGHHGGRTSTTEEFLKRIAPKYAVISVGKDNDYGHPHKETLQRLAAENIELFRTDMQGNIVASSDGSSITINNSPVVSEVKTKDASSLYIGNKNSKVFHLPTCPSLPKLENQVKFTSKAEAQKSDYKPCQKCKP